MSGLASQDIAWLAQQRVDARNAKMGQSKHLDNQYIGWARLQTWEGHVRELFATLDRAYRFSPDCWGRWNEPDCSAREARQGKAWGKFGP